jgi:hypothetical protein
MEKTMKTRRKYSLTFWSLLLMIFLLVGVAPLALGQVQDEAEPNNSCEYAQNFGPVDLPFIVEGKRDEYDVDFYRFTATPGTLIQVDLEGQATGKGTLSDPLMGFFDSNCNLIAYNDDYMNLNSRLIITVPPDGVLIIAATSCPDYDFAGNGNSIGTYQLTLSRFAVIDSISGSVVDSDTGSALGNADVVLHQCTNATDPSTCYPVNSTSVNYDDGTFSFSMDWYGRQLAEGIYLVVASAQGYSQKQVGPFEVEESEDYDLGNIELIQNPSIGSISGTVVDALTGVGLSGQDYPNTYVVLSICEQDSCYSINDTNPDGDGKFTFVSNYPGQLPPGNYEVRVSAQDYQAGSKELGYVDEDVVLKDIVLALEPVPVKFSEVRPCGNLPNEGGTCKYSVRIHNRSGKQLQGAAWSIVDTSNTSSLGGDTIFQTANPIKMTLKPGASRVVDFQFHVPSSVGYGAFICPNVWFGENSNQPFFNTLNHTNLFCIMKGETIGLKLLSQKEVQKLLRDQHRAQQKLQRSRIN